MLDNYPINLLNSDKEENYMKKILLSTKTRITTRNKATEPDKARAGIVKSVIAQVDKHNIKFIPQDIVTHPDWGKIIFIHPKSLHGIQVEVIQPNK